MVAPSGARQGYLGGEFLTRRFRISAEVFTRTEPLLDQLNDHMALFLQLERLFISPLADPAALTGNYPMGNVRKSNLALVVLARLDDGLPRRQGQYVGRDHIDRQLILMVGGFEVRGALRVHPSVDISNFVRTTPEQFIPLFNASATLIARPDIVFNGGALLVNRAEIEVFCPVKSA